MNPELSMHQRVSLAQCCTLDEALAVLTVCLNDSCNLLSSEILWDARDKILDITAKDEEINRAEIEDGVKSAPLIVTPSLSTPEGKTRMRGSLKAAFCAPLQKSLDNPDPEIDRQAKEIYDQVVKNGLAKVTIEDPKED